jgi:hypothetical protein
MSFLTVDVVDTDVEILPEDGEMREALARAILPVSHSCGATAAAHTHILRARRSCSTRSTHLVLSCVSSSKLQVGKGLWEVGLKRYTHEVLQ